MVTFAPWGRFLSKSYLIMLLSTAVQFKTKDSFTSEIFLVVFSVCGSPWVTGITENKAADKRPLYLFLKA